MLHLIEKETQDDIVLAAVSRTLSQAIDELTALQRTAMEVMQEAEGRFFEVLATPASKRPRMC